jgi:hypothetical protein
VLRIAGLPRRVRLGYEESLLEVRMKLSPETFVARGLAAQAAVDDVIEKARACRCSKCGGTGKVDRGNGSTKPCDCTAGLIERARRRALRNAKRAEA